MQATPDTGTNDKEAITKTEGQIRAEELQKLLLRESVLEQRIQQLKLGHTPMGQITEERFDENTRS